MSSKPIPHDYSMNFNTSIYFVASRKKHETIRKNLFHFHNDLFVTYFSLLRRTGGLHYGARNMCVLVHPSCSFLFPTLVVEGMKSVLSSSVSVCVFGNNIDKGACCGRACRRI